MKRDRELHERQGRRPDQVAASEKIAFWAWVGLAVALVLLCLLGCRDRGHYTDRVVRVPVDSVEWRGVGRDNTLQVDPYWKVWIREPRMVFRSSRPLAAGDTVEVIIRKWNGNDRD